MSEDSYKQTCPICGAERRKKFTRKLSLIVYVCDFCDTNNKKVKPSLSQDSEP